MIFERFFRTRKVQSGIKITEGTHLDLGCGTRPHNPYGRSKVYGVDIRSISLPGAVEVKCANLAIDTIPFESNQFDSVSAFDFLEHIPRILSSVDGKSTANPFVMLMNEVWRVSKPGGRFYALTPCYPSRAAFQDPTHVNIITDTTHEYFTGDTPPGRMYGFMGSFRTIKAEWTIPELVQTSTQLSPNQERARIRRARRGALAYFLWELEVQK